MFKRILMVLATAALTALYSCNEVTVHRARQGVLTGSDGSIVMLDASPAPDAGSGSSGGPPDAGPIPDAGSGSSGGPPDAGPAPDAGSGSGSAQQIRFSVSHHAGNMRDASAANARLDLLLADDVGGLGALGYGGCAIDPVTVSRWTYTSSVPIYYQGSASSGSFYTTLAHGQVSAQIVCTSGPIPPPSTGPGSDVSSAGPVMPPTYDPPPPP